MEGGGKVGGTSLIDRCESQLRDREFEESDIQYDSVIVMQWRSNLRGEGASYDSVAADPWRVDVCQKEIMISTNQTSVTKTEIIVS